MLPVWFPGNELAIAFVALVVAVVIMNRGDRSFINLRAQDEPVLVALGVFIILIRDDLAGLIGGPMSSWVVVGLIAIGLGVIARYTRAIDFKNIVP